VIDGRTIARRFGVLVLCGAATAVAQAPPADPAARTGGGSIVGVVRDSIARGPLGGAWVQLVESSPGATRARTAVSDSLGRFQFSDVPFGRYTIGFFHPLLDSLGVEPPLRQVSVGRRRATRVELATPSAARIRSAICGRVRGPVTGGAVLGVVRDARTHVTIAGATVTGEWLEVSFQQGGNIQYRRSRVAVTTADHGWFALCNVPARGVMYLRAVRGADSTDAIDVQVPGGGVARQELYVGPSRLITTSDSTLAADSLLAAPAVRVGDGTLRGTVVVAGGGRLIADALVRLSDNPPIRADARGGFTLTGAPFGTRMLAVRAVGYAQARLAVNVVDGGPPVTLPLVSTRAVLDTVKVVVARVADRHQSDFEYRRRSLAGMFLTADQIARRGVFVTSDLFRRLRGMKIGFDYDTLETDAAPFAAGDVAGLSDRRVLMRGISGNWCEPALWFDGTQMSELSVDALDSFVTPERIAAIEIYTEATVPAQFQRLRSGCGAVLFWTK